MRVLSVVALSLSLLSPLAFAQEEPPAEPAQAIETVLVTGTKPGPGLWKVSKDDHVLWILATYGPLPDKFVWRSKEVETIVAQSQEYLGSPSAATSIGFFRSLTLMPYMIGINKNPDGATLKDLVPADIHARWTVLKNQYIGPETDMEKTRPIIAASRLFSSALDKVGLNGSRSVHVTIDALVKQHKLKVSRPHLKLEIREPRAAIKKFKASQLDDVACFSQTIARLETDLDAMRARANAWAIGDTEELQKLKFPDQGKLCANAALTSAALDGEPDFKNLELRMRDAWLAAAEKALGANQSTFGTLGMHEIVGPLAYLAVLKERGYEVTAPQ